MRTIAGLSAALFMMAVATPVQAQRSSDVDGAESCRAIWREYGRSMSGRPIAVYCEVRDIGVLPRSTPIDIDGGSRSGVVIRGEQRADTRVQLVIQTQGQSVEDARDLARGLGVDLSRSPLRVSGVDTEGRGSSRRFVSATIVVDAPTESNVTARVNYAPLSVDDIRGRIDVRAEYGPLALTNVGGDVRARVDHGPLSVSLSGSKWVGTGLDAESDYGPVTLRLPREYAADLTIGARHGPFDVDFPLTLTRFGGSVIETKLGAGGPPLRAVANYGPMSLRMSR
jgi:hypothetical protein